MDSIAPSTSTATSIEPLMNREIKTLIFFDFETTGLIPDNNLDPSISKYWRPRANPAEHQINVVLKNLIKFGKKIRSTKSGFLT